MFIFLILSEWAYRETQVNLKVCWKYAPPPKKMVKPKVKRKGERRRGITKSLTERTTATEEPMTEASLSVKSSPSGGMKIYADLTWNSFFCVWTRGDAGLIMNANLMKYIVPLTFVEHGFVVFRGKNCRNQVSREYAVYSFMHSVYSQYGFSLLNPLLSKHVQTVWLLMFYISGNAIILTLTCFTRIKMSRRR